MIISWVMGGLWDKKQTVEDTQRFKIIKIYPRENHWWMPESSQKIKTTFVLVYKHNPSATPKVNSNQPPVYVGCFRFLKFNFASSKCSMGRIKHKAQTLFLTASLPGIKGIDFQGSLPIRNTGTDTCLPVMLAIIARHLTQTQSGWWLFKEFFYICQTDTDAYKSQICPTESTSG